jgi:hypothetical protein
MRAIISVILAVFGLTSVIRAQDADEVACYSYSEQNHTYKKKLWAGYEVSVGPSGSDAEGENCTMAINNSAGKAVFRIKAFSIVLDEAETGEDFDEDGKPEVVVKTDIGGGNHCCWGYTVISLFPKAHKLFDIAGAVEFEKDEKGRQVIWTRVPGLYGYTSMANNPYAEKVFRFRNGQLVDVTPAYDTRIFSDENDDFSKLTPERIKLLQSSQSEDPAKIGLSQSMEEIVSALLSRALQHIYCHQFNEAMNDLDLWPLASRAKMKEDFAGFIKGEYPEFAARLQASK